MKRDMKKNTGSSFFGSFEKSKEFDPSQYVPTHSDYSGDLIVQSTGKSMQSQPALRQPKKSIGPIIHSINIDRAVTKPKVTYGAPARGKKDLAKLLNMNLDGENSILNPYKVKSKDEMYVKAKPIFIKTQS